jgi:hypothetical protein
MITVDREEMIRFTNGTQSFTDALFDFLGFMEREKLTQEQQDELTIMVSILNVYSMYGGAEYVLQKEKAAAAAPTATSGKKNKNNLVLLNGHSEQ